MSNLLKNGHAPALIIALLLAFLPVQVSSAAIAGNKATQEQRANDMSVAELEARLEVIDTEILQLAHCSPLSGVGNLGYRSKPHTSSASSEWVQIQLESLQVIDEIILVPAIWRSASGTFLADGFPERFRILVGGSENSTGTVIHSYQLEKGNTQGIAPVVIPCPTGTQAKWIRIEAEVLSARAYDQLYILQFAEVLVFNDEANVALQSHSDAATNSPDGHPGWGQQYLTDGFVPYLMNAASTEGSLAFLSAIGIGDQPSITLDLGSSYVLSQLSLHAIDQSDTVPQGFPGDYGIPKKLIIEGDLQSDFSDAVPLFEYKRTNIYKNGPILMHRFPETLCRYVRLTAIDPYIGSYLHPQTGVYTEGSRLGFAEIEFFADGKNVALNRQATTNFTLHHKVPTEGLTDGKNRFGPILSIREWLNQLARRQSLEAERKFTEAVLAQRYQAQQTRIKQLGGLAALLAIGVVLSLWIGHSLRKRYFRKIHQSLAANLHDDLGASLHTIGLISDVAQSKTDEPIRLKELLQKIRTLSEETSTSVRHAVQFQNSYAQIGNLAADIRRTATSIAAEDMQHELTIKGESLLNHLTPEQRTGMLMFYKECLVNISKHSGASRFITCLIADDQNVALTIYDNGTGVELSKNQTNTPPSLTRRARLLGAKISVTTPTDGGTRISLTLPRRKSWLRRVTRI